jgi:hypothetical protein
MFGHMFHEFKHQVHEAGSFAAGVFKDTLETFKGDSSCSPVTAPIAASVPEPTTFDMVAVGILFILIVNYFVSMAKGKKNGCC